ncbi:uncharacterized protein LOC111699192 [Eurytemora carolleeae]|uniref:uncharacterized protein LOC111699192 n=1 Tax=Eurytemora carolleeae TaxID=1294199 RepID=UPI000C775D19|nr:uncharacterized protein LOC111699192 [Eurytemora carolleeae]|eukprot:XP_023325564.1 uncharacterized protein LOC111699192 [Eurytemora affinis]
MGTEPKIVIYSITGCPHCVAAKNSLQENGLTYVDVGVDRFPPNVREWVAKRTGKTSVPQIFFNSTYVGGNLELNKAFSNPERKAELLKVLEEEENTEERPLLPHPSEAEGVSDVLHGDVSCEKEENVDLINQAKEQGVFKTNKRGLFCGSVPDSATGSELVSFLVQSKGLEEQEAVETLKQILEKNLILSVENKEIFEPDSSLYRFGLSYLSGLNTEYPPECVSPPADQAAQDIRKVVLKLFADFLSPDGKYVDYKGMASSSLWEKFKLLVSQLQRVDVSTLSEDEKLAFFINIYNVLVIHVTVERGVPGSLYQRYKFFSSVSYVIGGFLYSLNDIENGILRSNRQSMGTLYRKPFKSGDPRLKISLAHVDPRIHFALNCGAKSCPPIKTFSGDQVQDQLQVATSSFLESDDAVVVNTDTGIINLSQLFNWYSVDFGDSPRDILTWITERASGEKKAQLSELLEKDNYKIVYLTYDWGNNEKK